MTATQQIGKAFGSDAIKIFGTVFAVMLVLVWVFVFVMMVRSFAMRRLLWPGGMDGSEVMGQKWRDKFQNGQGNGITHADP